MNQILIDVIRETKDKVDTNACEKSEEWEDGGEVVKDNLATVDDQSQGEFGELAGYVRGMRKGIGGRLCR